MRKIIRINSLMIVGGIVLLLSMPVMAQEEQKPITPEIKDEHSEKRYGINLDFGFASAYLFRGINMFQNNGQMNQHTLLAPSITWQVFDTGLSIGYIGVYQLNGGNTSKLIDAGTFNL